MQKIGPPSGVQQVICSGDHEAVVVEIGGGLRAYRVAGRDVVDGYAEDEVAPAGTGQLLAPWPNRIRDGRYTFGGHVNQLALSEPDSHNAIHGLVRWMPWRQVGTDASSATLACTLPAQPGYPWTLDLAVTWSVGDGGLRAEHSATNLSGTPAPFGLGVHPYVTIPGVPVDDLMLTVPARTRLLVDARGLPIGAARVAGGDFDYGSPRRIGQERLDVAFGDLPQGGSRVTLSTVDDDRTVTVWADAAFGWWQVYTGDTLPSPRTRRSVAIEPMTCPPDAFHSGRDLVVLEPGQTWRGAWGITADLG